MSVNNYRKMNGSRDGYSFIAGLVVCSAAAGALLLAALLAGGDGPADCPAIGDECDDGSYYVGSRELTDAAGKSLGDFDLFAAQTDLTDGEGNRLLMTFNDAVNHVAGLRDLHGHDGGRFENEAALYQAIGDGTCQGEWFIPPRDVLLENLYPNKDAGGLSGTFAEYGSVLAHWYWSCTQHRALAWRVYDVDFTDGFGAWDRKDSYSLSGRVVRAEPRP